MAQSSHFSTVPVFPSPEILGGDSFGTFVLIGGFSFIALRIIILIRSIFELRVWRRGRGIKRDVKVIMRVFTDLELGSTFREALYLRSKLGLLLFMGNMLFEDVV
jgi:hypothetical protein